jgi:DNA polymerase III sliding clamp (beta) subunit (PCNA family)
MIKTDLIKALNSIKPFVLTNPIIPVLSNVLIGHDEVIATNLEVAIRIQIDDADFEPLCISFKDLLEFAKSAPEEVIFITPYDDYVELYSGKAKVKLPCISESEFPKYKVNNQPPIKYEGFKYFKNAIRFVGNDDLRMAMKGISISDKGVMATDAHRGYWCGSGDSKTQGGSIIVPSAACKFLATIPDDNECYVSVSDNTLFVRIANSADLTIRLIDEKFPALESVYPTTNQYELYCDKWLIGVVDRASKFQSEHGRVSIAKISDTTIEICTSDVDYGKEYKEQFECANTLPEGYVFGVNAKYFIESLTPFAEGCTLLLDTPNRAIFAKVGEEAILVMPVVLNN